MSSDASPIRVGIHMDATYERHDTGPGHPESAHRYRVLRKAMESLPDDYLRLPGRMATTQEILLAHEAWYYDLVLQDTHLMADSLRTGDTAICEESNEVAHLATGAVLNAVDAIMTSQVKRAFCAIRPPGHHATSRRGMGFCIFNHIAIAARYLQKKHGLGKIAIIDWDVHHGNGTEEIFYTDPSVLYISLHEEGIYPHTGKREDRGTDLGLDTTINIPLPTGSSGPLALKKWDQEITPAVEAFHPDFILVSAGFDAREGDPIGGLMWTDATFAEMTRRGSALADHLCQGRLLSALEGGYNPEGLASAALSHIRALRS
jgi:acetoin utilization deacetylase AcuC-like enzyme